LLAVTLSLGLSGCSAFQRDWQHAAQLPSDGISGRWEGTWRSESNGHQGKLRCLLTMDSDGAGQARFRATYLSILSFTYTVALDFQETNGVCHFTGSEDLGAAAGGKYDYQGVITATHFNATYRAAKDHGVFEMQRP
jgi:hypothetical protein